MIMIKSLMLAAATVGFVASGGAMAQVTPEKAPPGVTRVEAKDIQELQAKGAILVDARKTGEYSESTIKGAISVPYDPEKSTKSVDFDASLDRFDMSKFTDKNANIVTFCNGPTCWKGYKAAVVLSRAGFKNIYWYRVGLPDWKDKKLPTE